MTKQVLPIDQAPVAQKRLSSEALNALNLTLRDVRLAEQASVIAQQNVRLAGQAFVELRRTVSAELGVSLGETHGWDERTGELRELQAQG